MYPTPGRKLYNCGFFKICLHETKNTETRESIGLQLSSYILIHWVSIVEHRYYAASVKHEAFKVIFQFDEPNNQETTDK